MQYSTNFNMNKPERADQYNIDDWNENTDTIDSELNALQNITDETFKTALLNFCYPIGSLYWSSNSADPSTLFGGTWTQIKDKFVWAKGDNDTVNDTGGAKTHTIIANELPQHIHAIGGNTGAESSHTHSLNDHTHSFSWTGSHSHGALSRNWSTNVTNECRSIASPKEAGFGTPSVASIEGSFTYLQTSKGGSNFIQSISITVSGTSGKSSGNTGTGSSHNHTLPANTGNNTTNASAIPIMPPYIVKYCWERTA